MRIKGFNDVGILALLGERMMATDHVAKHFGVRCESARRKLMRMVVFNLVENVQPHPGGPALWWRATKRAPAVNAS